MQRPSFARADTDGISLQNIDYSTSSKQENGAPEYLGDVKDSKGGAYITEDPEDVPQYDTELGEVKIVEDAKDLVTQVIHVDDDPTVSPWTFRAFFLGIGLAVFGSVLQEIFYFKPQTIFVSVIFLCVIAYVLGELMALVLPRKGAIGRFLNPHKFNVKEHAAITMCASAGAVSALATEALAAQALYYGGYPNKGAGVFITLSSQLLGYGVAGLMRPTLVYPTKMLYPINLPLTTLLETLHRDKAETKARLRLFYILFVALFIWEIFPEYIFPLLTGISIFCLAKRDNLVFTNLFGGAQGNEGLGFLSICLDWNYIAGLGSPLWMPLQTLVNSFIGYLGCIILFMALYYSNTYRAQDFPFLSQVLFTGQSNGTYYDLYNQSLILNPDNTLSEEKLDAYGLPYMTATYIGYLITTNMGTTANLAHMFLWNYNDIKTGWDFAHPRNLKKLLRRETWIFWKRTETKEQRKQRLLADPQLDPHYKLMLEYEDAPTWWYGAILVASIIMSLVCLYVLNSTLPWWGFILACLFLTVFLLFFGAQYAITGFGFNLQPVGQMLAGYLFPGRPLANMYFTLFTYNAQAQGLLLLKDLKLAQYVHLSPICTFTFQTIGCVIGALFNYIMMLSIVQNQADILKSVEGTNIWSGQNIQQFNTLAITWSMASKMFSVGGRYEWVTISYLIGFIVPFPLWIAYKFTGLRIFSYINLSIILWYMGWLFVGINSSCFPYFVIGFISQWWIRRRYPQYFVKYNYIVSAAMDGGTQVLVFVFTFAVFGGSGTAHPFPVWAGNTQDVNGLNIDYCMINPGVAG